MRLKDSSCLLKIWNVRPLKDSKLNQGHSNFSFRKDSTSIQLPSVKLIEYLISLCNLDFIDQAYYKVSSKTYQEMSSTLEYDTEEDFCLTVYLLVRTIEWPTGHQNEPGVWFSN